jgi:DNA (cytosine-5)-methyltransferase 1
MRLTMGSLFAGIGGFDLGFERAGFKTVWQVEIDPYCQKVLAKNFPEAKRFGDIRECGKHNLEPVDVICGGFPCQDISNAGKRAGINGERSGLWSEMHRTIGELRPRFAVVENVAALLGRGMGRVLGDLAEIGYDAEWEVVSAADVGAPHIRERLWIVAYPNGERFQGGEFWLSQNSRARDFYTSILPSLPFRKSPPEDYLPKPFVIGSDDGIPDRAHRIRGLGNAVVPQIPELIARRLREVLEAA